MEVQKANGTRILELDTVRALHQTVVSLRAALEASKTELHDLRQKYELHQDQSVYSETLQKLKQENNLLRGKLISSQELSVDGTELPESLLNNPVEETVKKVKFNLDNTSTEPGENIKSKINSLLCESTSDIKKESERYCTTEEFLISNDNLNIHESVTEETILKDSDKTKKYHEIKCYPHTQGFEQFSGIFIKHSEENIFSEEIIGEFDTKIELESRFDLTIKLSAVGASNLQPVTVETNDNSSICVTTDNQSVYPNSVKEAASSEKAHFTATDSESISFTTTGPKNINFTNCTDIFVQDKTSIASEDTTKMAGSREGDSVNKSNEKFNVQVKITSEEDLVIEPGPGRESNSEYLTMEPDDLSIRSISEGDNSVFSETVGGGGVGMSSGGRKVCEQDSISGNDSEEVDDIELIFTTDETKELTGFQEDLVSITEGDHWTGGHRSDASTPVLLRFNLIDPEVRGEHTRNTNNFENENQENSNLQGVMADADMVVRKGILRKVNRNETDVIANEIRNDVTLPQGRRPYLRSSSSKNYLDASESAQQYRKSFESNDSCSFDNQKSYSFDNTKSSSFERGSSIDAETKELSFDQRDESLDQFDMSKTTLRSQYSIYVETDISKCGVVEDDGFSGNLNLRRNTCPNPFQYRPLPHRDVVRGVTSGTRPLLALPGPRAPRRSSAAQTHISALPGHWRSDTQLARKVLPSALTTLPSKVHMERFPSRLAPSHAVQTSRRTEESRRVLLSDIGFTSMVPELSRSAEPVWAGMQPLPPTTTVGSRPLCCAQHAAQCFGSVPSSPTRQDPQNAYSRYWSKGSMQRSFSGKMGDTILPGSLQRTGFFDQPLKWRGSLPELRAASCPHGGHTVRRSGPRHLGDSEDSTEELLDEAEFFLRSSIDCLAIGRNPDDEFCPSNYSRPYLPSGPRQLRLGHLVKVIAPHGKIALGKVRYVGVAGGPSGPGGSTPTYVGVQLGGGGTGVGGGDGTFRGRRYFHCEKGHSLFVPFSKVVMAWADC